ncbi:hypothetical protein RISW2_10900 [Roseivivax isoporae LMG 25204]|uniref:Uncharacterized protein n=1 Tax=Roseivivax isoporae LMG 25204 TaxID=1449351 RepID=X7F514_9RHOB|nr:hypothetical protein RISW2_10900 [Roseivivax isoporae LMG 25204]
MLAIWNGIAPDHEAEFLRWHVREHIPERLSVPGFLRARRYAAHGAHPAYFNFYEVESPGVLASEPYRARLDDPTEWTRQVVPHFTDTSRTFCVVADSRGHGVAGFLLALRLQASTGLCSIVDALAAAEDVSAVHLLERTEAATAGTAESAMRSSPDGSSAAILLIEGVAATPLLAAAERYASDGAIRSATGSALAARGLYQLDFLMDRGAA